MKKVLLLAVVGGMISFTSCKKETNEKVANDVEQTTNNAGDAISDAADDLADGADKVYEDAKALVTDAPQLENAELQEWANKLHDEAVKAKAAAKTGNADEMNEAIANITSLSESLVNFKDNAEYAKAEAYYNEIKAELEQL